MRKKNKAKKGKYVDLNERKRKAVFVQIGKDCYDFDVTIQYPIYKYLCGEKLRRREFRKLENETKFFTYRSWHNYVYNKYREYDKTVLREFVKYLKHREKKSICFKNFNNLIYTAVLSAFFSFLFSGIISLVLQSDVNINMSWPGTVIWVILFMFFIGISMIPIMIYIIVDSYNSYADDINKSLFFKDFRKIIEEIIVAE